MAVLNHLESLNFWMKMKLEQRLNLRPIDWHRLSIGWPHFISACRKCQLSGMVFGNPPHRKVTQEGIAGWERQ